MNFRAMNSLYLPVVLSTDVVISSLKCIFHILSAMYCGISWWQSIRIVPDGSQSKVPHYVILLIC